jgi:hypothetical protein
MSDIVEDGLLSLLRKKIREHMNEMSDNVSTGNANSFDEYKRQCGVIEGLAIAEREILDLDERLRDR